MIDVSKKVQFFGRHYKPKQDVVVEKLPHAFVLWSKSSSGSVSRAMVPSRQKYLSFCDFGIVFNDLRDDLAKH